MVTLCTRLFVVLICACAGMTATSEAMAAPVPGPGTNVMIMQDDSLLPSELDPDDDDDGVADIDDSAPNDPNAGQSPPAGTTDSGADSDNDGLPNVMDPDDNNNGQPDADEGLGVSEPAMPAGTDTGTSPGSSASPARSSAGFVPDATAGNQPLIRALPVTGSGSQVTSVPLPVVLIGITLLLATSGFSVRKRRP